ncbi:acyl carrier protein [Enorma massiliensis]|uniref:Acyl carrier protein n=1 Tax=Enorma massiliensis TaxID=1472761 RepID=A0A1Y3U3E5_9ACTN|nr:MULTISPECIES: acyl carrier protein [Enorma]CDD42927.1 acyl carrier protein 1 [Collinsella sp. CAG:398]SCH98721.1 Acyl carrier protein [uncultured Collinsella sp.]MBM6783472.1 acyl carrier protein [Enorma massiliensis]MBM6892833.1 acyl carrier protein [Enorma massiliensis]MCI7774509.1 acyl carrier protein [Enorma sp.]
MDRTEIFNKVADIASDVLGIDIDQITEETTFDDLDADSLDRLQLVTAFEDEFDIEMDEERLLAIASVADAIDAIEATQQGA